LIHRLRNWTSLQGLLKVRFPAMHLPGSHAGKPSSRTAVSVAPEHARPVAIPVEENRMKSFLQGVMFVLVGTAWIADLQANGVFTAQQAESGQAVFNQQCAECHHQTLRGTSHGPELAGPNFLDKWGHATVQELVQRTREIMPPNAPDSLGDEAYSDLVAHILQANGAASGDHALSPATSSRISALLPASSALATDGSQTLAAEISQQPSPVASQSTKPAAAQAPSGFRNREVAGFRPVSEAMLQDPPPGDWLNWRRTRDAQGYSPLDQVNRHNVGYLKLAWSLTMNEGSNQGTPLVHDGVMFLTHPGNRIQAIAADTGELIWEFRYEYPPESVVIGGPTRNIALYQDKLFLSTYDAALLAIDAVTGKLLWRTVKADWRDGYTHSSGPVIANGVVVSGINGCGRFKKGTCFVTGHDPDTGKELWRTSTIALPGDPNDASWGGVEAPFRAGGDTWIAGSYDAALDLFYIGVSQAKPWVAASRDMSIADAALYTNSTLALRPKTGEMVWYFQHVPGETLDMDVVFERVLADSNGQHWILTVGKDGILWKLDRETGRFLDFVPTMDQDIFTFMDRETGKLRYREDILKAGIDDTLTTCPGLFGGHVWQATTLDPQRHTLVVPAHNLCMEITGRAVKKQVGYGGYGVDWTVLHKPGVEGKLGRLSAWDIETMQPRWVHEQEAMFQTSALATAGGLVFIGDLDRYFKAFDIDTGEELWHARLGAATHGFVVTYATGGRQYVAVQTGMGATKRMTAVQSPEIYQPEGGNALYVFDLPDPALERQ
jgi:alcohol dehydrogenase (cytochrome c)